MALRKELILLKYLPAPGNRVNVIPEHYAGDTKTLITEGSLTWAVVNTGTAKVYLWESVILLPQQSFSFPNYTALAIANNVKIKWEGDFEEFRDSSINTAVSTQ